MSQIWNASDIPQQNVPLRRLRPTKAVREPCRFADSFCRSIWVRRASTGSGSVIWVHFLLALSVGLPGCAQTDRDSARNSAVLQDTDIAAAADHSALPVAMLTRPAFDNQSLSLGRVLMLVAAGNADLMATSAGVDAVAARRINAGMLTNPEGSIYSEDFGGPHPHNMQTTLQLSQALPLTNKLSQQQTLANDEHDVARRDFEIRRLEIFGDAARTFIALLVAQQRAALANEQLSLVERLSTSEQAQVDAGQAAPFERSRAIAASADARLRALEARQDIQVLRTRLASFWGGEATSLREATGDLTHLPPIPARSELMARIAASPEMMRSAAEIALRRSAVALERSKATPDIVLNGGIRRHEAEGNYDFVAGASMPLPVINQNQSGIAEAAKKQQQAEFQQMAAKNRVKAMINEDCDRLSSIAAEIDTLQKTLIPSSESAASALREGYRLRKFRLSELLIAEQSLNVLRDKLLTTLGSYHQSYVDLEQLLGGDLYVSSNQKTQ